MASGPEFEAKRLCFLEAGVEDGFLMSRRAKLSKSVLLGLGLLLTFVVATMTRWLISDWSTCGGSFIDSDAGRRAAQARIWAVASQGAVCVIGMVIAGCARLNSLLSARGFEAFSTIVASLITIFAIAQHPWYLARSIGIASPETIIINMMDWTDDKFLLMLDIWLTGCHLLLPIRWIMLWPVEVAAVLVYPGAAIILGSHVDLTRIAMNTLLMSLLVLAAAWGKRALEVHERTAFAQLAKERVLRCQAEHKLSKINEARETQQEADAVSVPVTTNTSELFDLPKGDGLEVQLEKVMALGLRERWLMRPEDLQPVQHGFLGQGGFGTALLALYQGTQVVLKAPKASADRDQTALLVAIATELRILRHLRHPNIVTFYGGCINPGSSEIVLVLEHVQGKELGSAISGVPTTPLAIGDRCTLARNVCSALCYLHSQTPSIIHADIKASNVMVEQFGAKPNAKLLDFGLSTLFTQQRMRKAGGSLRWMAPERIAQNDKALDPSSDIFSLGRTVYTIMTGRSPLAGVGADEISAAANRGECLALQWPEDMPLLTEARALCEACSRMPPASRPDIMEVQASLHQWSSAADLPDDLAAVLRETFPNRSSSDDVWHAIADARLGRGYTKSGSATVPSPEAGWEEAERDSRPFSFSPPTHS